MTFDIQKYQKFALMQLKGRWKIAAEREKVALFSFKHGMAYLWTFLLIQ